MLHPNGIALFFAELVEKSSQVAEFLAVSKYLSPFQLGVDQ